MTEVLAARITAETAPSLISWADPLQVASTSSQVVHDPLRTPRWQSGNVNLQDLVPYHPEVVAHKPEVPEQLTKEIPDSSQSPGAALKWDYIGSPNKLRTLGAGALYFGAKAAGRGNLPGWLMAAGSMDVLQATHSPLITAAANGVMVLGWSATASHAVNTGFQYHPHWTLAVGKKFSGTTNFVADFLPGLRPPEKTPGESQVSRLGGLALTRTLRGLIAYKQLTRYIGTANYSGQSPEECRRLCWNVSADAAIVSATLMGAFSGVLETMAAHNPGGVTRLENDYKSWLTQSAITSIVGSATLLRNRRVRRKAQRLQQAGTKRPVHLQEIPELALEAA